MSYSMENGGGVDASIPLRAGQIGAQQPNPLQQIGQFANTLNAINQTKMFPGEIQRQKQAIALGDQAVQGGDVDLHTKINQAAYGSIIPLLALPPGTITHDSLTSALAGSEKNLGIPTHGVLQNFIDNPMPDGLQFDAYVRARIAAGAQPYHAAAGQVTPQAGPVLDVGPTIQPTTVSPAGAGAPGVVTPAGPSYGKGLSPGEATAPTQLGVTPQGAPVVGTRQQFIDRTNGQPSPLGTGRLPQALRGPNAPPESPAQAPGGGVVTGVGPAQAAEMTARAGASAHAFQDYADQSVQARSQSAVLGNMLGDISSFTPGPEKLNEFQKTLQRYSPTIANAFGVDPKSVAANESFDKLANQIAGAQGERSDARLAVAQNANPGSHLSQGGADLIIRQLQGNADYLQARGKLAADYPDQTDRAGFEKNVGANLDPRAFQFNRMTPEQKTDYVSHLSKADKTSVQSSYNYAFKNHLIGGGNGG